MLSRRGTARLPYARCHTCVVERGGQHMCDIERGRTSVIYVAAFDLLPALRLYRSILSAVQERRSSRDVARFAACAPLREC